MKYILAIVFASSTLMACENHQEPQKPKSETIIKGKIAGIDANQYVLFYKLSQEGQKNMDTIRCDAQGNFEFYPKIDETYFYRMQLSQNNFTNIILSPKDSLYFDGNAQSLEQLSTLKGSAETQYLKDLSASLMPFYIKADSLQRLAQQYQQAGNANGYNSILAAYPEVEKLKKEIAVDFVQKHPKAFASLAATENLDLESNYELFQNLAEGLKENYPNSSFAQNFIKTVEASKKLAVGQLAPEIELNDPNGNPIKLSSLQGKVVLIDFWASWCRPCRMENPNVVKIYNKYAQKGFEIYGVSLDKTREAWLEAIKADGLTWKHVSDLGFWNSSVVPIYNVQSIPKTYLIDKDGRILAKDLRGEALENKIAEILK